IDRIGERLLRTQIGAPDIANRETVRNLLTSASGEAETPHQFSPRFLLSEWENVVDAWQLDHWEAYRDVKRLGRKTRLPVEQRLTLWSIFARVKAELRDRGLRTRAELFSLLVATLKDRRNPPFDFVIVDEAQDINVAQLRFLAALGAHRPNGLFFAGDLGQRIFQTPFSWKALGVDVRGRSQTLKLNYRTPHQIRMQADRLLGPELADVDGNVEDRRGTVSAFNGERPAIQLFETEQEEGATVASWLRERRDNGVGFREVAIFVRSRTELDRARRAVRDAGLSFQVLDEGAETNKDTVSISTMHLAKGLEFRAVAVMACDDEVIPLQERIETVADDADLEEVYNTERHLLYVACTRARDYLMISGVAPASEFLDDLQM
ncbi:MAG: DNA helicase, partial [Gammaproteobacteria bacterium]|nr:DNA helicase [Gammaproteobacteria bacterium]